MCDECEHVNNPDSVTTVEELNPGCDDIVRDDN